MRTKNEIDNDNIFLPKSILAEAAIESLDNSASCGYFGRIEVVGTDENTDIDEVEFTNLEINLKGLKYTLFECLDTGIYADENENILHVPQCELENAEIDLDSDLRVYVFENDVLIVENIGDDDFE